MVKVSDLFKIDPDKLQRGINKMNYKKLRRLNHWITVIQNLVSERMTDLILDGEDAE